MKKVLVSFLALICMASIGYSQLFANETSSTSEFNPVIKDESLAFKAVYEAGKVYMSWTQYNKDETLQFYKVVRSTKNENPIYPEDGYIKYSDDISFTKWVDLEPPLGYAYYRVCAITTKNNRYCSNVAKVITKTESTSTTNTCPKLWEPVCGKKDWVKKTFDNKCFMNEAGATYIASGICWEVSTTTIKPTTNVTTGTPAMCTMEYAPVCWKVAIQCITTPCEPIKQTFWNKCMLKANSLATFLYEWECSSEVKPEMECVYKNNTTWETYYSACKADTNTDKNANIKIKAKTVIDAFIAKLEKKWLTSEQKVTAIDTIIKKLNTLKEAKPTLKEVITYMILVLEEKKTKYQNDFSDIEQIFNDF